MARLPLAFYFFENVAALPEPSSSLPQRGASRYLSAAARRGASKQRGRVSFEKGRRKRECNTSPWDGTSVVGPEGRAWAGRGVRGVNDRGWGASTLRLRAGLRQVRLSLGFNIGENTTFYLIARDVLLSLFIPHPYNALYTVW